MKYAFFILLFIFLTSSVFSQNTPPKPTEEDEVVKISTELVQLDTIVTDKNGNPVTNLTMDDFEILQDGKSQKITNLIYIERNTEILNQTPRSRDTNDTLPPPASVRSAKSGRVLTFVVDDGNCSLQSFAGMRTVRNGLRKFVKEQMLPNDSVAIYRSRGGNSLLQQYTSDKARLLQIIEKIDWLPVCQQDEGINEKDFREVFSDFTRDTHNTGLLSVLRYAIKGLYPVSGRKILFLLSDGFIAPQKQITNLANRASVVINSIDIRGLEAPGDTSKTLEKEAFLNNLRQSGLSALATETGGRFYKNMNFLDYPIQQILKSESGYYLLAYQPEEKIFKGKNFHKIEIKLKRSNLISSSRSGFYAVTDDEMRPKPRTGDHELYDLLTSPLPNTNMNTRLLAYLTNSLDKGNFIRAFLYIDGKDIMFVDNTNGNKKAVFDIIAVTLDEQNQIIDDSNSTRTIQIPSEKIEEVRKNGLIYKTEIPIRKEGIYTFRIALRDANAKNLGSSSQVIEVPRLTKDKIFLSGLVLSKIDTDGKIEMLNAMINGFSPVVSKDVPAIRQFKRNTILGYAYTIYNAKIDASNNQPKLLIQTNLYSDGKLIMEGTPQVAQIEKQTDMTRINDYGYLKLNQNLPIGDYALQLVIKDLLTNKTTSQWIDFEVVE